MKGFAHIARSSATSVASHRLVKAEGGLTVIPRLVVRELHPMVAMPLNAAAYCADCEAVFDGRNRHTCPACASSVAVPVSSLINKSSFLAQPGRLGHQAGSLVGSG
jgi:hypothetical protein